MSREKQPEKRDGRHIEKLLWKYLQKNCLPYHSELKYSDEENIFNAGIIDSAGLVALVVYIEEEFSIEIPDEDLMPQNFLSVKDIADYIRRKLN